MKRFFSPRVVSLLFVIFEIVLGGLLGGFISVQVFAIPRLERLEAGFTSATSTKSSSSDTEVVSATPRPPVPVYPAAFLARRAPAVALLVRRSSLHLVTDHVYAYEHPSASAVAVTTDGWFASTAIAFAGLRLSDLSVVWNNRVYPIQQAVRDTATDVVFFKLTATDLPVAAFVSSQDLVAGAGVWVEPRSMRLYPDTLTSIRAVTTQAESVLSERALRRFTLAGNYEAASGGAVWDGSGRLVGLLESKGTDGWQVIPASNMKGALASLLAKKDIAHASLGVRVVDLSQMWVETSSTLPAVGAWIKSDHTGASSVPESSPAAHKLQEGDVIERIERDILDGTGDLGEHLLEYEPGTVITLAGHRGTEPFTVNVTLGTLAAVERLK